MVLITVGLIFLYLCRLKLLIISIVLCFIVFFLLFCFQGDRVSMTDTSLWNLIPRYLWCSIQIQRPACRLNTVQSYNISHWEDYSLTTIAFSDQSVCKDYSEKAGPSKERSWILFSRISNKNNELPPLNGLLVSFTILFLYFSVDRS